ncbi:lamin tail domain-containing protein [Thermococcus sp. GR7]|uniref:lamin tail domain-containing protein n=1 Tax=unclassified Thermococcus TaxID=2627626 RepID=UPI00142F8E2B|nr:MULTISPECIES: lamin tail domain-containing protein [unclassified Thermococcus]NJE47156.1 lamin tail domain-containing protein [Thermococcus sp. GR7]NJE78019.1 lamin tail domain-containing protein [Thermococcus sp. GR4]NJF22864.1 lamin tail domain-containing protein [Thermococcus sp. GR5]
MPNATEEEKEALLTLIEAMLNGTLNGEITVSDTMKIKNAQWNGTDLIFEIWWYDGINPVAIKTYRWRNPRQALQLVHQMKNGKASEESLEEAFTVGPLTISYAVHIEDVDYLTNDGSGEYVLLHNPGLSTVSLLGWYIMDEYAYNNPSCWINNTIPRDDCIDSYGKDHVVRFSINIPPGAVVRIPVASSPYNAILNNDGDTVYLIDDKGYFASMYSYSASPEITVEGISYYPNPLREGDYMDLTIVLDNRGALDGTGTIEVYIDGKLVKSSTETVWKYHIWYYKMYEVWKATSGSHVLTVKFVPQYGGEVSSKSITFTVSASEPYITEVTHNDLVEGYPAEFHVDVVNPAGERKDIILKLFIDGVEVDTVTSYVYEKWEFDLQWSNPEKEFHKVEIKLYDESGTVLYSQWASTLYFRPNTPPRIESLQLPSWVYANEWSEGTIQVYDSEGDLVDVEVNVIGRFSFTRSDLSSGVPYEFPLAPIYNHTNCRENVTVEFTLRDQYGMTGETITKVLTVVTDSDKDGWCNAEDIEPFRDATVTVYIFRYRKLDAVSGDVSLKAFTLINGKYQEVYNSQLAYMTTDYEKRTLLGENIFSNLDGQAIAKFTFDIPDNAETVDLWLNLNDGENVLDISPTSSLFAHIVFNTLTGIWSGDDYPDDHKDYFGYGHLSGCGDGSCGDINPSTDIEPFSKYYDEIEALGYDLSGVNITNVQGWDEIESLELKDHQTGTLYQYTNPDEAVLFTIALPNGTQKRVLIINKRNAEVKAMKLNDEMNAMSTGVTDKDVNASNMTTNATAGIGKKAKYEATLIFRNETEGVKTLSTEAVSSSETSTETSLLTFDVVATSEDIDEDDAEIWFLIKLNDADGDGIPFYKELELNKELGTNRFSPSINDAYGDYDGDGVPNSVELFIGKDPAKRDILGIELNISVEWTMSEEDKKNLIYSIRRASGFIYDYTDGYAMITKVNIWDDKRNWDIADVRVHDTTWQIPQISDLLYPGWPKSIVGGYWMKRDPRVSPQEKALIHIMMPEKFWGGDFWGSIGEEDWGETLGHELGHYVFWLRDEYQDWQGHKYQSWYVGILNAVATGSIVIVGGVPSALVLEYYAYKIQLDDFMSIHSVMNKQWKWSELSTPKDYENFKRDTEELWNKTSIIWKLQGYTSPKDMLPDQWGDPNDPDKWHSSGWETVYKILTSKNLEIKACVPLEDPSKGSYLCSEVPIVMSNEIELSFVPDYNFIPETGPYTGVGYFMEVTWG